MKASTTGATTAGSGFRFDGSPKCTLGATVDRGSKSTVLRVEQTARYPTHTQRKKLSSTIESCAGNGRKWRKGIVMNDRLIEALLRLCELEKQAKEDVIAHLRNEISENTLECDHLGNEVTGLQLLLSEERKSNTKLRQEQERAQAGWVHIRNWTWHGVRCIVAGLNEDRTAGVFERRAEGWFVYGRRPEVQLAVAPLYIYELPADPIRQKPVIADPQQDDEWKGEQDEA